MDRMGEKYQSTCISKTKSRTNPYYTYISGSVVGGGAGKLVEIFIVKFYKKKVLNAKLENIQPRFVERSRFDKYFNLISIASSLLESIFIGYETLVGH